MRRHGLDWPARGKSLHGRLPAPRSFLEAKGFPYAGSVVKTRRAAVVLALVMVGVAPWVLGQSDVTVATVIGEFSLVTIGLVALHGYAGQLSLGQGGFMAITAYTMAWATSRQHWPSLAALSVGAAACGVVAVVIGLVMLRMRGLYLALATLAFADIVETLASGLNGLTGGPSGEGAPVLSVGGYAFDTPLREYYLAWVLAIVVSVVIRRFAGAPHGRAARAVGRDELVASSLGVPVLRYKMTLFALSGMLAGVAGGLYAATIQYISPSMLGVQQSLQLFVMHVLGGSNSVVGAVIGVAVLQWIPQLAPSTQKFQLLISGAVLLVVLRFFPMGLVPGIGRTLTRNPRHAQRDSGRLPSEGLDVETDSKSAGIQEPARGRVDLGLGRSEYRFLARAGRVAPSHGQVLLETKDLSKAFGGLRVLNDVCCSIESGSITSIIGPNGAGKTTLINVVTGVIPPTRGNVFFKGENISTRPPHHIANAGIARTYQTPRIDGRSTVLDNVLTGRCMHHRSSLLAALGNLPRYRHEEAATRDEARELIDFLGLSAWLEAPSAELPLGHQRRLEIARALMQDPTLLVLDEPAAGSNDSERRLLSELLASLNAAGQTILLIEHNMDLVMSVSDRVIVLDQGRVISSGDPDEVRRDPSVIEAYLGSGRTAPSHASRNPAERIQH